MASSPFLPPSPVTSAPPPPAEVKVRTMRSDLESMIKTGGGLPRFQDVKIAGLSAQERNEAPSTGASRSRMVPLGIAALLLLLVALGYLGYRVFFAK